MAFYGRTYYYPTPSDGLQVIGVCQGLGGVWIVGYQRPGTGSTRRINTPHLPPMKDMLQLQGKLDAWAAFRKIKAVA
jgi:hypothetical protein